MTAPATPRIRPGRGRETGLVAKVLAYGGARRYGIEPVALFLTLGRHRRLFRGWLHFAGRLMPGGTLPRRDSELVILRVAALAGSDYEFAHHERIGAAAGLDAVEIARTKDGPEAEGWTDRQRDLLRAVDEMVQTHDLSDATWSALRRHVDEQGAIEFCLLAGHYRMLADVIAVLRLAPERPRDGD